MFSTRRNKLSTFLFHFLPCWRSRKCHQRKIFFLIFPFPFFPYIQTIGKWHHHGKSFLLPPPLAVVHSHPKSHARLSANISSIITQRPLTARRTDRTERFHFLFSLKKRKKEKKKLPFSHSFLDSGSKAKNSWPREIISISLSHMPSRWPGFVYQSPQQIIVYDTFVSSSYSHESYTTVGPDVCQQHS